MESYIELQQLDCNCNDCFFMQRDSEKFKESLEKHHKWQLDYFNTLKNKMIKKANFYHRVKGDLEKFESLSREIDKMKFQFDKKEARINYGYCNKLSKEVSFIPSTLQLETQECFLHRKEI